MHRRPFDVFISHDHSDADFVAPLHRWLTERAGLRVWYDAIEFDAGGRIASVLQTAIEQCKGMLLVASAQALDSGWVADEYNVGKDEMARSRGDFRLVPVRLGGASAGELVRGISWIDLAERQIDPDGAVAILRSFYPGDQTPDPDASRDVYVSASWRRSDGASARAVCKSLVGAGFRLIGDSKDQAGFGDDRVSRIVASCGAAVVVIPYRNGAEASATDGPYRYFLRELELAMAHGLPTIVVADPRITRIDGRDDDWLRMDTDAGDLPVAVAAALDDLWEQWVTPPHPHRIFIALDLDSPVATTGSRARRLIERVTGMPTDVGNEILTSPVQAGIVDALRKAVLVIADITGDNDAQFNLDTSIEAGIASALGTHVQLLARGRSRRPPFMLRNMQMLTYENEVELIGLLHSVARRYRRRVINTELAAGAHRE